MKNRMGIPPEQQETWTWPAVAMFTLVGMGVGLYLSSAILNLVSGNPRLFVAGPIPYGSAACLTVILGFLFVLIEAGRPLKGYYALSQVCYGKSVVMALTGSNKGMEGSAPDIKSAVCNGLHVDTLCI